MSFVHVMRPTSVEALEHPICPSLRVASILEHPPAQRSAAPAAPSKQSRAAMDDDDSTPPAVKGSYIWEDSSRYFGDWDERGLRHGAGNLILADGTRYAGAFKDGLCSGVGVMLFPDGAKYEGELYQGWFHGRGVFWRADGMKYEGEFRGGRIWGYGLVTFNDGSNGYPRNEGFFQDCRMVRRAISTDAVLRAQRAALLGRAKAAAVS